MANTSHTSIESSSSAVMQESAEDPGTSVTMVTRHEAEAGGEAATMDITDKQEAGTGAGGHLARVPSHPLPHH